MDVLIRLFSKEFLPRRVIYIGAGSQLNKQRTIWASPFEPGFRRTYEECALQYAQWIRHPDQAWLLAQVRDLRGCALACECPPGQPCHGEVLAAAAAEEEAHSAAASSPLSSSRPAQRWSDHWGHERAPKRRRLAARTAALAALFPAGAAIGAIHPSESSMPPATGEFSGSLPVIVPSWPD